MAAWRETTSALAHCQIVRGRWCLSLSPTRCRLVAPIYPLPLLMTTTMRFVAMPPCRTPGDSISLGRHTESIRATIVCTPINWLCAANSHLRWPSPWPLPLRCSFLAISVRLLNRWPHQRERRRIRSTMTVGWLLFCLNFSHFFCLFVCSLLSADIFYIRVFFFTQFAGSCLVCWQLDYRLSSILVLRCVAVFLAAAGRINAQ